jgi:hypothetical protein
MDLGLRPKADIAHQDVLGYISLQIKFELLRIGRMSLEHWAAVAEIVGAIAVVATLIYLAIQVKQNTGAIQSSNAMVLHNNISDLARDVAKDRDLGDIIVRALDGTNELSPAEKIASYGWFYTFFKTGELAHMAQCLILERYFLIGGHQG